MKVGDILRKKSTRIAHGAHERDRRHRAQLMRAGNVSALVVKDVVRTEVIRALACSPSTTCSRHRRARPPGQSQGVAVDLGAGTDFVLLDRYARSRRHLMNKHHIRHMP